MRQTEPSAKLIARPEIDWQGVSEYLGEVGGLSWVVRNRNAEADGETLPEFAGRMCYRSWEPGLNPNVIKVRASREDYLENVLRSTHGSVLEHAQYSFVITGSRVLTHEWVRHRPGTAISQESMRFVRLTDMPFWFPEWALDDPELMENATLILNRLEWFQRWMGDHFKLDDEGVPFHEKKHKTSFMRRFAPEGVSTALTWSANIRTLRHVIEVRTAEGAEEEIRLVAAQVGEIMKREAPILFSDFEVNDKGEWVPRYHKV